MLAEIKKRFFALRNGVVADTLRKAGMPYKMIFGLQVPQLAEIARSLKPETALADELWKDRDVRESRLLACYLFPVSGTDMKKALALARDARTKKKAICSPSGYSKNLISPIRFLKLWRLIRRLRIPQQNHYGITSAESPSAEESISCTASMPAQRQQAVQFFFPPALRSNVPHSTSPNLSLKRS